MRGATISLRALRSFSFTENALSPSGTPRTVVTPCASHSLGVLCVRIFRRVAGVDMVVDKAGQHVHPCGVDFVVWLFGRTVPTQRQAGRARVADRADAVLFDDDVDRPGFADVSLSLSKKLLSIPHDAGSIAAQQPLLQRTGVEPRVHGATRGRSDALHVPRQRGTADWTREAVRRMSN